MAGHVHERVLGPVHRLEVRGAGRDRVPRARPARDRRADQGVGGRARARSTPASRASGRNRPDALAAARSEDAQFVEQALTDLTTTQGAPPEEVAGIIVDAIRAEQFLVPTKPSYAQQLRVRFDALVDKQLPPMPDFD